MEKANGIKSTANGTDTDSNNTPAQNHHRNSVSTLEPEIELQLPAHVQLGLDLHNNFRQLHGLNLLAPCPKLIKLAASYATEISEGSFFNLRMCEHSSGQNSVKIPLDKLKVKNGTSWEEEAVRTAVTGWYSNIKDYNWEDPMGSPRSAQEFCEMVRKSVGFVGVGAASFEGQVVVVALYSRAGKPTSDQLRLKEDVVPPLSKNS